MIANGESELEDLTKLVSPEIFCRTASAQESGSFELLFDNGIKFVVSVEDDLDPKAEEYWRLFAPALDTAHFVVGPRGVGT